jgi:hypothetical protein
LLIFNIVYFVYIVNIIDITFFYCYTIVTDVIVVSDGVPDGAHFAHDLLGGDWVQTYMDNPNTNYAAIGYTYDATRDAFIAPKANCHAEEVLDEASCRWSCANAEHDVEIV